MVIAKWVTELNREIRAAIASDEERVIIVPNATRARIGRNAVQIISPGNKKVTIKVDPVQP